MIFSKCDVILDLVLGNIVLEVVTQYKTLGIILDNKLTYNGHVNFVIARISWTLRRLYNLAYYLPLVIRRRVALSLCMPLIIYGIEVYSCTSNMNLHRLKVCFNRVIRYIFGLRLWDHVSEYCVDLLGCSFEQYLQLRQIIFFYKTIKNGNPSYLLNRFRFGASNRTCLLLCPRYFSLLMARSYHIKICRLWNTIIPYNERTFNHSLSAFIEIFLSNLHTSS